MLLTIFEEPSIGDALFDQSLYTFAVGLFGRSIALELDFLIVLPHQVHLEPVLVLEKALHELKSPFLVLVLFILDYWFALGELRFLFASQSQDLVVEERGVFIDETKQLVASLVLDFPLFDVDTGAVAEGEDGLALVIPGSSRVVLVEGEAFLPHLDKFALDLFEVRAEAYDFLETRQTGHIEKVGLVVDEEVAHLIGLLVLVLSKEDAYPVIQAVHYK